MTPKTARKPTSCAGRSTFSAVDHEIQEALLALDLPGNFRTLVVPDNEPRTKPKALNYALQFARGVASDCWQTPPV